MVRRLEVRDAEAVAQICAESLGHETDAALVRRRIGEMAADPAYYAAVYEDGGEVTGFIQAQRYDLLYGERGWNIIALAVCRKRQGRGAGRALVSALEKLAMAQGAAFVRLNSRTDRTAAHGFYEHLGYRCDKEQKRFIKHLQGK